MKVSCKIIQDLFALYCYDTCSKESKELIEHHLKSCEHCRQKLQQISEEPADVHTSPALNTALPTVSEDNRKGKRGYFNKWIKITLLLITLLLVLLSFAPYTKLGMYATVKVWENQLTTFATEQLANPNSGITRFAGYRAECYHNANCVFFEKPGAFAYKGFFYSESGEPIGYQGTNAEFKRDGKGWFWEESDGDNWMYVEQISPKWYWYEMHF